MNYFLHLLIVRILFTGCKSEADKRFEAEYADGYAVGDNTECQIRATIIERDFDNVD